MRELNRILRDKLIAIIWLALAGGDIDFHFLSVRHPVCENLKHLLYLSVYTEFTSTVAEHFRGFRLYLITGEFAFFTLGLYVDIFFEGI